MVLVIISKVINIQENENNMWIFWQILDFNERLLLAFLYPAGRVWLHTLRGRHILCKPSTRHNTILAQCIPKLSGSTWISTSEISGKRARRKLLRACAMSCPSFTLRSPFTIRCRST